MPPGPDLQALARSLVERGAAAVVLVGSHARGAAHALSDVDLYALGEGPETELQRRDGHLLTVAWRTPAAVRASFATLPACTQAVPAWRSARILEDPAGAAAGIIDAAHQWTWDDVEDPDGWCTRELPGYAEEVQKLRAALESRDLVSAAIWRNVLAMRMAVMLAVHHRLLVQREEEIWPRVAELMGHDWRQAQRHALGLDGVSFEESCHAALELYRRAVSALVPFMTTEQLAVAGGALPSAERRHLPR